MPTYEYRCTDCGEDLEAVQAFSDAPLTECPVCGGRLRKVFSAVGVVFKGSGFYRTDSRSAGKGAGSGANEAARPAAKAAGDDTPSKPAAASGAGASGTGVSGSSSASSGSGSSGSGSSGSGSSGSGSSPGPATKSRDSKTASVA